MPPVDGPVDYETFSRCDRSTQVGLFNAITPENRAELVRTQATRWLAHNREILTAEQIAAAEAAIAIITPALYRIETSREERRATVESVERSLAHLFTRDQMWRFIGPGAPYLPPSA